jgi:biotin synthase
MPQIQADPRIFSEPGRWRDLAERVLEGHTLTQAEGLALLRSGERELLEILAAAYRIRYEQWGNRVHLNFLVNAKSGSCAEDCGYCSQSKVSDADILRYKLLDPEQIYDGARVAAQRQAKTYCIVISGRSPRRQELEVITSVVRRIKESFALSVCVSPGLLNSDQALQLKQSGVNRVNHNLNTSERFYPRICTTHTYQDRLDTLRVCREVGLELCSGGIVGMGEEDVDIVDLALRLGEFRAEAVPINFLLPIAGTSLENVATLTPSYCLKVLALVRLANPRCELRIAAGREVHLRSLQPLGLFAADSIFVGDYLTTKGQPPSEDYRMIEDLGFQIVLDGAEEA